MRISLVFIFAFVIAFMPQYALSKKAATIDELADMYDIKSCAECHEEKYEEWKTSSMGNSVADPRVLRGMRTFIRLAIDVEESLKREDLTICLDCHVPQIKDATPELIMHIGDLILTAVEEKDEAKKEAAKKELSKLNLNCLGCHNLRATGFHAQPKEKVIYGPRGSQDTPHEDIGFQTEKSGIIESPEFCAQCHHCPPSVPWNECPTLYTSYIDDFIKKGRTETCQDCHMPGKDHSHKFLGPGNLDFLKSAISLDVNARQTKYIDIYENKKMPAMVVRVNLTNHAGHEIPHGCAIMPKIVMDVTIKDQDGKEIFSRINEYTINDLFFKGGKQTAMAEWDVTATEHFGLGIEPLAPDIHTFIIPLEVDTTSVDIEVSIVYLYSRDKSFTLDKVVQKVIMED